MAKYLRYETGDSYRYGRLDDTTITPLDGAFPNFTDSSDPKVALSSVKLLSPTTPTRIVSAGPGFINGKDRATLPRVPTYWHKPLAALNHHEGDIEIPDAEYPGVVHECELGIVIGKKIKCVGLEEAKDAIFGYTIYNDVTRGDFNKFGNFHNTCYYAFGKTYDGFAPMGPYVVTDLDPTNLRMICRVNGEVKQDHSTSDRLFEYEQIVSLLSYMGTLNPGDVISTGSPPGHGAFMQDGDVCECEIEGIGVLRNTYRMRQGELPPELLNRKDYKWPFSPVEPA